MIKTEWKYIFLIISIFIAACIETDIYLPAFTDMMAYFEISENTIQGLLTWNFIGICLAGPIYGPVSDAVGRKKPLLCALGLFFLGSVLTLFADNFYIMLAGRVLQGLGSGGCFTLGTAVIFDIFALDQAIQALNKINSIVPFIMAAAPMVGGYLNYAYGFRSNFLAIAVLVFISSLICLFWFKEPLAQEKRVPLNFSKIAADFGRVLSSVPFWQTTLIVCLLFSGYITFLSGISVLYVVELGVSKTQLPLYQAALLGAWLLANLFFKKAIVNWGKDRVKKMGTALFTIGGVGVVAAAFIDAQNTYLPIAMVMLNAFGANWTQGLYFPEGMDLFPEIKGITASILTSTRLMLSAAFVGLAATLYNGTIYPIAAIVGVLTLISFITILWYEKRKADALLANT
jgi:MFS transporter, DHA1 family, multidrug resistance protein